MVPAGLDSGMNVLVKAATIYDVARAAGVSHQTVSRFLAGFEGIRPETRSRVESALVELQYRPNSAARQLRSQRSNRIAALADRVDLTGPARIVAGATAAARDHGYLLDVVLTNGIELEALESALALVQEQRVVGIVATAQTDALVGRLRPGNHERACSSSTGCSRSSTARTPAGSR
jgi:DNA-binding LacI/PurR family transcriptional regulator